MTAPSVGALEAFLEQVVVDEYADIPEPGASGEDPGQGSGRRLHVIAAVATVVIGLLVAVAVLTARGTEDQRRVTQAALADRVAALTTTVAQTQATVEDRTAAVEQLRQRLVDLGAVAEAGLQDEGLAAAAAAVPLAGPGVTVTVDDAPDAEAGSLNRVLDRDLQDIVNAVWEMGASGVAVNGQRLTAATAIRNAGEAILVNYQPITRPYVVTAVGTTTSGTEASPLDRLLQLLARDYGLVTDVTVGDVALPAGEVRTPRYATPDSGGQQP